MSKQGRTIKQAGLIILMSFLTGAAFAADTINVQVDSGGLAVTPTENYETASLRVSSDSYDDTQEFSAQDTISLNTSGLADGIYNYEVTVVTKSANENSDNTSSDFTTGQFRISAGIAEEYNDEIMNAEAAAESEKNRLNQEAQYVNTEATD